MKLDLNREAFKRYPIPEYQRIRTHGPAVRTRIPLLGKVALLTTHAAGSAMLKDPGRFVVDARRVAEKCAPGLKWWVRTTFRPLADNLFAHDDPEHRRLRKLVDQAFHRRSVESYRDSIGRITDRLLDDFPQSDDADLMRHFA